MNKLQIIADIFGCCFTPWVKVDGERERYTAKFKLDYFGDFSALWLKVVLQECKSAGIAVGIDFVAKEFTLTFDK